jgi:hypothetical protein
MDFQSSIQPMGFQPIVFEFFCLDTKKVTKKSQGSNEYSQLLPYSFVRLLYIVVSALVMLFLTSLQLFKNQKFKCLSVIV